MNAESIDREDPILRRIRYESAATLALNDLVLAGVVTELAPTSTVSVPTRWGTRSGPVALRQVLPALANNFCMSRIASEHGLQRVLDPDVFTADLDDLGLDPRARRTLAESLSAYRRGMWLASASLLGAVSEASWFAAGEQLRTRGRKLAEALDQDNAVQVIRRVSECIRQTGGRWDSVANELESTASYLRDIRNYGVHPRAGDDPDLEDIFTEHGCALLLLRVRRYLGLLKDAVQATVAGTGP